MSEAKEDRPSLLVIAGPTASGKTSVGVEVARALDGEIVGADSMQVYRRFDIGTAKPTPEELGGVPHQLIDVVEPDGEFDAASFAVAADDAVRDIATRGKRAIVVGGTGLYIRVLLHGLQEGPPPAPELRGQLLTRGRLEGWPALHGELAAVDPEAAARLHVNDGVRIVRALEVFEASGVTISDWQRDHGFRDWRYGCEVIGLRWPREELNARIDERVEGMMAAGFLEEVRGLLAAGYGRELKPMQALGYKQLAAHLAGELPLEEAVEKIKVETRRFAKRQLTWFNKEPGLEWVEPDAAAITARARRFFRD